ncbi:MAG: hypothetical protein E6182_10015 [Clostridioides difficile]|nr:hypothetical protein [Clostridioides difficile]
MLKNKSTKNKTSKESLKKPEVFIMTQSNTEELEGARTATTGEEFTTLDERIDCEVDRLNKKIEVSLLQQEDKESHTVENTIDGMTTDMCIKGRTLQNLCVLPNKDYMVIENTTYSLGKNFKPSTKYMLICDIKDSQSLEITDKTTYLRVDDKTGVVIGGYVGNVTNNYNRITFEFTTLENITGDLYLRQRLSLGTQQIIKNIVILEFDERYKNIPYFEGIKSFGEAEGNKISILSQNDNFINDISLGILNVGNGQESDSNTYFRSGFIKNIINNYYIRTENNYIVTNVFEYDENRNFIKQNTISGATNFKVTSKYFRIVGRKQDSTTITDSLYKNIVVGSKIYDKYFKSQQDKKDILLSELGFDEGLRGLNDIVYDELNSIKNVAIKRVDKYIVTGNESFITDIRGDYMYCYFILEGSKPSSGVEAICNQFKYIDVLWNKDNPSVQGQEGFDLSGSNSLSFQLSINKLETHNTEGVKKYFKSLYDGGNPVEVYYWLAEPIETPLDENINLKAFNEKTYVSFENSIPGTSSFKAPVDTTATIARLNRENRALEEENKTLRQDFESTTLVLTDSDLKLVKQNVDMDFRLMEVEFALDIPQAILSSNIKFKNKKGEVKSMARTPYEMMKIVILSGDYDREDYMYKVGKYYERGRMTKEEHDELMSLMTADEVISK